MVREGNLERADENKKNFKQVEGGIEWERSCTDILCCMVFIAFIVAMMGVSGYALSTGDPMNIITAFDSDGNKCGKEGTPFEEYKLKHFTSLLQAGGDTTSPSMYNAVCVSECPEAMTDYNDKCVTNTDIVSCNEFTVPYTTQEQFGYCMPTKEQAEEAWNMIKEEMNEQSNMGKILIELQSGWQPVAIMSGMTIIISIIYIWLLKYITKPLLYTSMLIIQVCFLLLGAFCWSQLEGIEDKESDNYKLTMAGAIISWVVGLAYLVCVCCCWKNIALGASIMECASDFVSQNVRVVALPVIAYFICIPVFVCWTYCAVYLYSIGEATYVESQFLATIVWEKQTEYLFWAYLFGLLWIIAFIICVQQFIIAATTCMWYFTGHGEEMAMAAHGHEVSVLKAIKWAMFYHIGSIAMGSFLVALVTFIRIIFEYIIYQYEKVGNKENPIYKCFKCVARCILWCLDKYVEFITKNAYIQIALHNSMFCKAAMDAFFLALRHVGRFSSAGMIGTIMMVLGKGTIMASSACLTYILISTQYPEVSQPLVGAGIVAMVSYLVGSLFLSVFSFSCTAILHCFILSEDAGGKSSATAPKQLQGFLDANDASNSAPIRRKDEEPAEGNAVE